RANRSYSGKNSTIPIIGTQPRRNGSPTIRPDRLVGPGPKSHLLARNNGSAWESSAIGAALRAYTKLAARSAFPTQGLRTSATRGPQPYDTIRVVIPAFNRGCGMSLSERIVQVDSSAFEGACKTRSQWLRACVDHLAQQK